MRVLHLSTSDSGGGAFRAACRLHTGLRKSGVDSRMLVQNKNSDGLDVYDSEKIAGRIRHQIRSRFDKLPLKRYPDRDSESFSPAWTPERRTKQIAKHDPDIVHLHWVADGFIRPKTIAQIETPIVWTLHDMWPFTGGCHYSKSCVKYRTECEACPHLGSDRPDDLANSVWQRKREALTESNVVVVSPSQWLAKEARASSLLGEKEVNVIPNCLDMNKFRPQKRSRGIQQFDLDENRHYILFGAAYQTRRKGGDLLHDALERLSNRSDLVALTFGNIHNSDQDFTLPVRSLGWLSEKDLRLAYSTVDATVVPSTQEAFGQTASESLASGTPVVAFNSTGLRDIVDHKETGYLAESYDSADLARGIEWTVMDSDRNKQLGQQARAAAKNQFGIEQVVHQYKKVY